MDDIRNLVDESPAGVYARERARLGEEQSREQRLEKRYGYAKLGAGALIVGLAFALLHYPVALTLIAVPALAFVGLAVVHEKHLRSIRARARALAYYERGLARVEDRWPSQGETGERFLDEAHPYARDLDIFGPASLFQLLSTAETRAGQHTLAHWLLQAAPVEEIRARQAAVAELRTMVKFRQELFSRAEPLRSGVEPEALAAWGKQPPLPRWRGLRLLFAVLAVLWLVSFVLWVQGGGSGFIIFTTLINLTCCRFLYGRLDDAAAGIEKSAGELQLVSQVLHLVEQQRFTSPRLVQLQQQVHREDIAASLAVRRLARLVDWLESRRNPYARIFDLVLFWSAQLVFAAERWRLRFGPEIAGWLEAVGELEALVALSGYAYEHPADTFPEFVDEGPLLQASGLAHPLLPAAIAVRNDVHFDSSQQLIILSGPNMAGKSTFIRALGVNAVLAQCGAPVRARRLVMSPLCVTASICVLDSLSGGVSRFYSEIQKVKLIADLARGRVPVLFLLDELLSGTNSRDRLAGTRYVVESLLAQNAVGIVSTHDLALTELPRALAGRAANWHFEDRLQDGRLVFDYKLKPGVVESSNALELMRSIGLEISR
jgi:hypothetical protein